MSRQPALGTLPPLVERFQAGDRRALARLITYVDNGAAVEPILAAPKAEPRTALKVGVTGPGGAGKSTISAALVKHVRQLGRTIAVLACDPASPFSGGALLGDRVRVDYEPADDGVFFRSLSSRGAAGGLAESAWAITRLLERFGFEVVLIETVGAGQDQLAVRELVDVLTLVVTPAAGDEIQWEKAGLLEAADLVVVNKADLPAADIAYAGLRAMLDLLPTGGLVEPIPILKVTASKGEGIEALWQAIEVRARSGIHGRQVVISRRLLSALQRLLVRRFQTLPPGDPVLKEIADQFAAGSLDEQAAAERLLRRLQ